MAVYTALERADIEQFIEPFGIGPLLEYEGVASGIENSNYFLSTDQSGFPSEFSTEPICHFVLTLFEQIDSQALAFYIDLTTLLNLRGLPVPCPLKDANGEALKSLKNKPALIVPKVPGVHPSSPNEAQCAAIGQALGAVHNITLQSGLSHQSNRNLDWIEESGKQIYSQLPKDDRRLLKEIDRFKHNINDVTDDLPTAIIHGDLFRDNAIFEGDTLTGIIDFNSAGTDYLLMDLAITVNDWCTCEDGTVAENLMQLLIDGYQLERPLTDIEKTLWNDFLRIAALRFWLSRLSIQLQPTSIHHPGSLVEKKDPEQYRQILLQHITQPLIIY